MVACLHKFLIAITGEGSRYLQRYAGSKGSCGNHVNADGIRKLKGAFFFCFFFCVYIREEKEAQAVVDD